MEDANSLTQIIGAVVTLTLLITSGSVYWTRKNNETLKQDTKKSNEALKADTIKHADESEQRNNENINKLINSITASLDDLKKSMSENSHENREDYKQLVVHIDERIEKIYNRLETNSTELKDYVSKEVAQLKSKDYDQDIKLEHSKDKIHAINEALLKFKLEVAEKYERKRDDQQS